MKFICTKDNLLTGLTRVTPVSGRNTQLPILHNVLLQLRDGVLHLTCTDLEIGIHTIVPGKVVEEGACSVAARKFLEYIQHLPTTEPIEVVLKKNTLHVKTTGFEAQFPTTAADDFPLLPQVSSTLEIKLKAEQFCQALTRTLFAAARDDTRPEIHSVFIVGSEQQIRAAATDSFRLTEEIIAVEELPSSFSFLLPLGTAQEVVRLFSGLAEITLLPHDNHIAFHGDGVELSSRLIDGSYPDYQQIIPTTFKTSGTLDREALTRALKTLLVFLPRDSRRVQLKIQPAVSQIQLSVAGSGAGAGSVVLDFEGEGEELEVLFNIQYLLEGVQYLPTTTCEVQFVGNADPAVFRPTDANLKYQYVVMPIQV